MQHINTIVRYRYLIAGIIFVILVAGKFHGSSIGVWDYYITDKIEKDKKSLIFGNPRAIRSDEWLCQTLGLMSQVSENFPLINPNSRSDGQSSLIFPYNPIWHWTVIHRPFSWGFMLFGKEHGFSWYWYIRLILLILLTFEFSMILTDKNVFVSILGAFWLSFSPGIQWWYSTYLLDLIIFSQAIIVSVWYYIYTDNIKFRIFLIICLTLAVINFILYLYPAMQVPLGYMTLIFIVLLIYDARFDIKLNKHDYILFSFSFVFILISVYSFISNTIDVIQIMLNTSYPGKRSITGGGFDFNYLQLYLCNWMLPYKYWISPNESSVFSNTCEASTFLNFLPAIMFSFFRLSNSFSYKRSLFYTLFIYLLFLITWLIFSYPEWFAKYTLFSFQNRLYYIVNLIALYLSIWTFSVIIKYNPLKKFDATVITILTAYIYSHSVTHSVMLHYLGITKTILSIFFFTALTFFFLTGMKKSFSVLMISYILVSGCYVNPVSRGLDPIYNKTITQKLLSIEKNNPDKRWVALNTWIHGDFIHSLGIKTINSAHFYPDLKLWNKIDPQRRYYDIYNRSAHVVVILTMNEETSFVLTAFDTFTVFLNINDLMINTDVDYILSYGKINITSDFLEEIESVEKDDLYIYKLKRNA